MKNKAQSIVEYATLLVAITAALIVMQSFVRRGVDSNLAELADKYTPGGGDETIVFPPGPCDEGAAPDIAAPSLWCEHGGCGQPWSEYSCAINEQDGDYCGQECTDCIRYCLQLLESPEPLFLPNAEVDRCTEMSADHCERFADNPGHGGMCRCISRGGDYDCQNECCQQCPDASQCGRGRSSEDPRVHLARPGFSFATAYLEQDTGSFILVDEVDDECYRSCMSPMETCIANYVAQCQYSCEGVRYQCVPGATSCFIGYEDCRGRYLGEDVFINCITDYVENTIRPLFEGAMRTCVRTNCGSSSY